MLGTAGVLMGGIVPFFPEPKAPPIKAEPVFQIGPVVVTNSMLGAIVAFIVVLLLIRIATRKLEERPGKFQAGVEFVVGGLYNFAKGSGGTTGAALFPLFAGLLIWLLVNNWLALIPGFGQILLNNGNDSFPLFRAANADFNNTLALALMVFSSSTSMGFGPTASAISRNSSISPRCSRAESSTLSWASSTPLGSLP